MKLNRFVWRQIYRLLIIWPYEVVVGLILWIPAFAGMTKRKLCLLQLNEQPKKMTYVCITSVIDCDEKKLSYSHKRSVYSTTERSEQTRETIQSIRTHLPQAQIILLEGGKTVDGGEVRALVDQYVYLGDTWLVRRAVDSRFKSLGEVLILLAGKKYIPTDGGRYYKVSGRYVLTKQFQPEGWQGKYFSFFYIRPNFVSTRLYSFSGDCWHDWVAALYKSLPYLLLDYPIEFLLWKWIPKKYQTGVSVAGVAGTDATTGAVMEE